MAPKLGQSLGLKQTQSLMMTPQLQQAIKMLTLTHLEMTNVISSEMVENPLLEETGSESLADNLKDNKQQEAKSENFDGPELIEGSKEDFDWNAYIEAYNSTSSSPKSLADFNGNDEQPNYENMVSKGGNLTDHLEWQLRMENFSENGMEFAMKIIHNLKNDGYLETEFEELLKDCKLSKKEATNILYKIQSLDPVGCACPNLEECLLTQARSLEERMPLVEAIIKDHLMDLQKKDYPGIAKSLSVEADQVREAELIISSFNPKPGLLVNNDETHYVVPDIYVKEVSGEFVVQLNDEGVPRLRISKLYQQLLKSKDNEKAKEYIQDKLRSALWLIKSIENRQRTIDKVAQAIVKYQPEFFKKGAECLKPMILKDIAEEIGMHESTVSRVTTNKYMHTPLGTFELKYFFNTGIGGKNGGVDIASESLKLKIRQLIENEDKRKPLSDQKIANLLKTDDIVVARRTVAKYREMMNILPSSKRKQVC